MSLIGTKTIEETKDYSIDWSKDIGTDVIASSGNSTWSIAPANAAIAQVSLAGNGTLTTVWVSGGAVGQVYEVRNDITTSGGRMLSKSFRLLVVASNYM